MLGWHRFVTHRWQLSETPLAGSKQERRPGLLAVSRALPVRIARGMRPFSLASPSLNLDQAARPHSSSVSVSGYGSMPTYSGGVDRSALKHISSGSKCNCRCTLDRTSMRSFPAGGTLFGSRRVDSDRMYQQTADSSPRTRHMPTESAETSDKRVLERLDAMACCLGAADKHASQSYTSQVQDTGSAHLQAGPHERKQAVRGQGRKIPSTRVVLPRISAFRLLLKASFVDRRSAKQA